MKYSEDQLAVAAEGACFYVTPTGLWLRVLYVEPVEGYFRAMDEDSGEEYNFYFAAMSEDDEEPEFHHLVRTKI